MFFPPFRQLTGWLAGWLVMIEKDSEFCEGGSLSSKVRSSSASSGSLESGESNTSVD